MLKDLCILRSSQLWRSVTLAAQSNWTSIIGSLARRSPQRPYHEVASPTSRPGTTVPQSSSMVTPTMVSKSTYGLLAASLQSSSPEATIRASTCAKTTKKLLLMLQSRTCKLQCSHRSLWARAASLCSKARAISTNLLSFWQLRAVHLCSKWRISTRCGPKRLIIILHCPTSCVKSWTMTPQVRLLTWLTSYWGLSPKSASRPSKHWSIHSLMSSIRGQYRQQTLQLRAISKSLRLLRNEHHRKRPVLKKALDRHLRPRAKVTFL